MFKVSAFLADTVTQTLSSLADCSVNDTMIKAALFIYQSFFQMIDVSNLATIHSLLQNASDRVVNRIEIRPVWWPVLMPDEVQRIGRQLQCNHLASMLQSRGIALFKHMKKGPDNERMAGKRYCRYSVFRKKTIYLQNRSINISSVRPRDEVPTDSISGKCRTFTQKTVSVHRKPSSAAGWQLNFLTTFCKYRKSAKCYDLYTIWWQ